MESIISEAHFSLVKHGGTTFARNEVSRGLAFKEVNTAIYLFFCSHSPNPRQSFSLVKLSTREYQISESVQQCSRISGNSVGTSGEITWHGKPIHLRWVRAKLLLRNQPGALFSRDFKFTILEMGPECSRGGIRGNHSLFSELTRRI